MIRTREKIDASQLDLKDTVVSINRVTKVVKGGKNLSFSALVVVGDGHGVVGFGVGKAREVPSAIKKGIEAAKKALIRVPIPALTEERRRDLVKVMHKLGEEGRVAVRHARGDAHARIKKLDKIAEDDRVRGEKDLQKFTDEHIKQIDQLIAAKEAEIMEV